MGMQALLKEVEASATPPSNLDLDSCCNCPQHHKKNEMRFLTMLAEPVVYRDISVRTREGLILQVLINAYQ
jgi:hypothetical protein